jgi:dihydrodipicolinate synthase/N-acetylneuraminate lyase
MIMSIFRHPITGQEVSPYLTGVIVPMFTPCGPGGMIDWDGFRTFVVWLRDHPCITTLFVRCGLGKMYTYTVADTKRAIDITMEALEGKKPAMFGTFGEYFREGVPPGVDLTHYKTIGKNRPDPVQYLDQTLELTEYARNRGATASVLVIPAALLPSRGMKVQDVIFNYYEAVSKSTDLPIFVYNTPGLPAPYNATPQMISRLSKLKNIVGMKLSTNNYEWLLELMMAMEGSNMVMIAGAETAMLPAIQSGACGVIGQGCDVNPEILRAVFDRFVQGDYKGALEAQKDIQRALRLFDGLSAPYSGLAYLKRKGLNVLTYGRFGEDPIDDSVIERIAYDLDRILAKYPVA